MATHSMSIDKNDLIYRQATDQDARDILDWLKTEDRETREGFYCNWPIIIRQREYLYVLAEPNAGAIAFMSGQLDLDSIVEVRPDLRGNGFGKHLVREYLRNSPPCNPCTPLALAQIQCAPITSAGFWYQCGFTPYSDLGTASGSGKRHDVRAYREFRQIPSEWALSAGELDANKDTMIEVTFLFADYCGRNSPETAPKQRINCFAVGCASDGPLILTERVIANPYSVGISTLPG